MGQTTQDGEIHKMGNFFQTFDHLSRIFVATNGVLNAS